MKEFDNMLELISKLRTNCPTDKIRTSSQVIECLKKEIPEVEEAIQNEDNENLTEELGDLLFNILFLIDIEKNNKNIRIERILEKLTNKMIFRHPHVFKNSRQVSIEEADKIWIEQKKKEKELGIKH